MLIHSYSYGVSLCIKHLYYLFCSYTCRESKIIVTLNSYSGVTLESSCHKYNYVSLRWYFFQQRYMKYGVSILVHAFINIHHVHIWVKYHFHREPPYPLHGPLYRYFCVYFQVLGVQPNNLSNLKGLIAHFLIDHICIVILHPLAIIICVFMQNHLHFDDSSSLIC